MIQGSGNRPMRASATLILATLMSCLPSISVAANPNAAQDTAPPAALKHALEEYEDRIDELTLSKGSSAFELAEEWVALGFARQRARDHRAAVDSFENALYIERLHKGLHHADQIPLTERLIESNRALGAWPAVAQNHTLLQTVNERGRDTGSTARTATAKQLARWHLEATELPTGLAPLSHLSTAKEMVEETLASMDATSKESALDYIEILNLQAAISFRTVHHLSTWIGERIHNRIIVNYIAGRGALDRAVEIGREQNNKAAQARAEQHIGDWHLLFGRRSAAAVHYKRAQRLAQEADITLFDKPRRLPGFVNVTNPGRASTPNGGHVNYVRTRFDIDRQGRARNVTILEVNPAGKTRLAQEARVQLRGTRFRPRFEGGKAVESKGVEIRFVFPHAEARGAQGATS